MFLTLVVGFSHSVVSDSYNPWTVTRKAPLSMGFSRQESCSGLPFPSPGDLPDPGIEPRSPALQADALPTELWIVLYVEAISIEHYVCFRSTTSFFKSLTCLDVVVVKCHSAGFQVFFRGNCSICSCRFGGPVVGRAVKTFLHCHPGPPSVFAF